MAGPDIACRSTDLVLNFTMHPRFLRREQGAMSLRTL